jgi:hypothetical protein
MASTFGGGGGGGGGGFAHRFRRVVQNSVAIVGGSVLALEFTTHIPSQGRASPLYHDLANNLVTPWMRKYLDPESKLKFFAEERF